MATYKVIQDIEAEDKFLGPLTLKQFIFGAIGCFFGYLGFFAVTKGAAFLLAIFMPPAVLGLFLAIPWSKDQPTEVWVLAKLRFRMKPKARIWDQSGLEELVTITAPKVIERQLTNGLDQTEVASRLKALAETIDTRGWAVKNATLPDAYTAQPKLPASGERLIDPAILPQTVPEIDINQYEDVLDEDTTVSSNFDHMIKTSSQTHMQASLDKMQRVRNGEPIEVANQPEVNFMPPSEPSQQFSNQMSRPLTDEQVLSQQLRNKRDAGDSAHSHLPTLSVYPGAGSLAGTMPADPDPAPPAVQATPLAPVQPQAQMTNSTDAAILNLAQNNDWNIDTIARQAKRSDPGENEVVISLR